jgi:asparagine synthase (glutamine-hydrolysing)
MCSIIGFSSKNIDISKVSEALSRTASRGPDMVKITETKSGYLGFNRLAIMGLTETGMQPFELEGDQVVCNGELYGFRKTKAELSKKYSFASDSDCEILLPLYKECGLHMFSKLDSEFALIIYDSKTDSLIAARDPIGIRLCYDSRRRSIVSHEAKNLVGSARYMPFPPGHYYYNDSY